MSTRALLMGFLVLGVGVLGYVVGVRENSARHERATKRSEPRPSVSSSLAPREEPEPAQPTPATQEPAKSPEPAQPDPRRRVTQSEHEASMRAAARQYVKSVAIPDVVLEEAAKLGVTKQMLRDTYAATWWLHAQSQYAGPIEEAGVRDSLAEITKHGERGFLSIVALLRGRVFGTRFPDLVRATWKAGYERHLVESVSVVRSDGGLAHTIYRALGAVDSTQARSFLIDSLPKRRNRASEFVAIAEALGALREPHAVDHAALGLKKRSWVSFHPRLLAALGAMGGDGAKHQIVTYLEDATTGYQSFAIRALARIDPNEARTRAKTILERTDVRPIERKRLRAWLDERK